MHNTSHILQFALAVKGQSRRSLHLLSLHQTTASRHVLYVGKCFSNWCQILFSGPFVSQSTLWNLTLQAHRHKDGKLGDNVNSAEYSCNFSGVRSKMSTSLGQIVKLHKHFTKLLRIPCYLNKLVRRQQTMDELYCSFLWMKCLCNFCQNLNTVYLEEFK